MYAIISTAIAMHATGATHWHGDNLVAWCVAVAVGFIALAISIARGE